MIQQRRLQIGTIEGIWAETNDMIENERLCNTFLQLMCILTKTQHEILELPLRLTFFEASIRFKIYFLFFRLLKN